MMYEVRTSGTFYHAKKYVASFDKLKYLGINAVLVIITIQYAWHVNAAAHWLR